MNEGQRIYELIKEYDTITIWGHARPDGDCYGSQIGLRELIKNTFPEKKVYAIGSGMPVLFDRLSGMDEVDDETIASSLGILVDVSCLRRVEDPRVSLARHHCKFDHHIVTSHEPFDGESFVDDSRVSASEIIAEWGFEHGFKFSKLAAESLYLGIVTDSGQFKYHGVNKNTFLTVAKLYDYSVENESIVRLALAFKNDPACILFRALIVSKAKIEKGVAYCLVGPEDYAKAGIDFDKACTLSNALDCFNTNVFALFAENEGEIRIEMRSLPGYPVQGVAASFGGGGHLYASGCTIRKNSDPSYRDVIIALQKVANEGQPCTKKN